MNRVPKMESYAIQQQTNVPQQQQRITAQLPSIRDEDKMPLFLIKLWNIVEDPAYQQIIRWDESGYSFHIVDPYSFCRNVLPNYFKHNNLNSLIRQLNMYGFRKMTPLDKGGLTRAESDQDHLEFSHAYFIRDRPDLLVNIKRKQSQRTMEPTVSTFQTQSNLQVVMDELRQMREKQRQMDNKMHDLVKENESLWEQLDHVRSKHNRQQQVVTKLVQFLVAMVQPGLSKRVLKRGVLAIDEPPNKRARQYTPSSSNSLTEILDRLQRELIDKGGLNGNGVGNGGPIIADVTEEDWSNPFVNSPGGHSMNSNGGMQASSSAQYLSRSPATQQMPSVSPSVAGSTNSPDARGANLQSPTQQNSPRAYVASSASYGATCRPPNSSGPLHMPPDSPRSASVHSSPVQTLQQVQQPSTSQATSMQAFSPTIAMSPSFDRQISQELQDYLAGMDQNIDGCRDMLGGWDFDPSAFDLLDQYSEDGAGAHNGSPVHHGMGASGIGQLALENAPLHNDVLVNDQDTHHMFPPAAHFEEVPSETFMTPRTSAM